MKKIITVTNWLFEKEEFVLDVTIYEDTNVCRIKASGPGHLKEAVCLSNGLEDLVSKMELEIRQKYIRTNPATLLREMGFDDGTGPLPGSEFTASQRHVDHCLDGLKSELPEDKFKQVEDIVLSVVR